MTIGMIRSDSQVKSDVLNELKWDPTVDETEVGVQVQNGIVTLTGNVSAFSKRIAAIDAAHRVYGVLDVVDDLKVRIPEIWGRTDQDIAGAVRHALKWDEFIPDDRVASTVSSGVVTLTGAVDTWKQRMDAEQTLRRLAGVRSVVNKITVATKPVDPGQLKRQIEEALERQTERETRRIGVAVRDGVVTLSGAVRSWAERNAMERAVSCAPGVRRVDDQTSVDPYQ